MINWQVRFKNPTFWAGLFGVIGSFVVGVAQLFGFDISAQADAWIQALSTLVVAIFGVAGLVGVLVDPTTKGVKDSEQAMTYTKPKE